MPSAAVLIAFALLGMFICAKARVSGGAVIFALIAIVVFIATPVGSGLPGAISHFVTTLDHVATPALDGEKASG